MKILLITSHPALPNALRNTPESNGFALDVADEDGADGKMASERYDAIVLEPDAADDSMLSLLPIWRRRGLTAGIFVLVEPTVNSQKRTRCLDLGADLVLGKPITTAELLARLRALTRRNVKVESNGYHVGELKINPLERTVHRGEKLIRLTPREFELLEFLVNRRGKIVSRMMIREHLFKSIAGYGSNVVDVYIRYLRRKIDKGFPQALILTHWGKGYEFRGVAEVE